jgi:hypothetical protein
VTELARHPKTGVHYAHVITRAWGPFVDHHALYALFAAEHNWMSLHEPASVGPDSQLWQDPSVLLIYWQQQALSQLLPAPDRQCHTARVFAEAVGDIDKMLHPHRDEKELLLKAVWAKQIDAVICHTPAMARYMGEMGVRAFVYPIGWDERVHGVPRFDSAKVDDYVYYGSPAGKRLLVMPFLKERLGRHLVDATGLFGRAIIAKLDQARASLYVAHSDVDSFSTWRIWQTLGSSACLVGEKGDSWPFVAGDHFVGLPTIDWVNVEGVAVDLKRILGDTGLLGVARRAHEEVAHAYTCRRCLDDYLVPAGGEICGS